MISSKIYINLQTTQQLDDNNFSINIIIKQRFFLSLKNILQYLLIFFSLRRFSYSFAFLTFASPCPSSPPLSSSLFLIPPYVGYRATSHLEDKLYEVITRIDDSAIVRPQILPANIDFTRVIRSSL